MSNRKPVAPDAEALAIAALTWLASDAGRIARFLDLTGLDPQKLRTAAREPGFLGAVLDHLLADETLLQAFAAHEALDPAVLASARRRLPHAGENYG